MHKYLSLLSLSWQNGFVYRTSVLLWRFRNVLSTIMSLTVWSVIFQDQSSLFQYSKEQLISYIFLVAVLQSLVFTSALNGLSSTIYSGDLSQILIKPINLFGYLGIQEVADKMKNFLFIILETVFLYLIFHPVLSFPKIGLVPILLFWTVGAVLMSFLIQLLFGALGFWSPETWGPRFLFFMFADFTAGKLFPLDILPPLVQRILFFTPFPYLSFVQIQLYLGKYSTSEIIYHTIILCFWIFVSSLLVTKIWSKGIKSYSASGQ